MPDNVNDSGGRIGIDRAFANGSDPLVAVQLSSRSPLRSDSKITPLPEWFPGRSGASKKSGYRLLAVLAVALLAFCAHRVRWHTPTHHPA